MHNTPFIPKRLQLLFLQAFWNSLTQVVKGSTHTAPSGKESIIDLALISSEAWVISFETVPPLANSDHDGIATSPVEVEDHYEC